jgi:hypothetical protein
MPVDKILLSHIVGELIIICGVTYYYHKKCNTLQLQINDLTSKLENLNGINYINSLKRQEQFETQTVQHINKIYTMLNNMNNNTNNMNNLTFPIPLNESGYMNTMHNMNTTKTENVIKEHYHSGSTQNLQNQSSNQSSNQKQITNPFMNTISMLGPLSTMFKVAMTPSPPHPDEIFSKIDIRSELNNKIVEIEEEPEIDSAILDNELKEELKELQSNITTAANTPVLTSKLSNIQSVSEINLCESGVCKLNFDNIEKKENETSSETEVEKININNSDNMFNSNNVNNTNDSNNQSSPLRYISQAPEQKRGRPKKS